MLLFLTTNMAAVTSRAKTQEKLKTMVKMWGGGGGGADKVYYGRCANAEYYIYE